MTTANDIQIGGDHYKTSNLQPWDLISRHNIAFLEGNIIKYMTRWRSKNGVQDLKKVQHYITKIEEIHDTGYEPTGSAGPKMVEDYCVANHVSDFREVIVISIFSNKWNANQLNHAALLVDSLIVSESDGQAETA